MRTPLWSPPHAASGSHKQLDAHVVFNGRSGVIRQAAAKMRDNPPTWRAQRRHGAVIITRP